MPVKHGPKGLKAGKRFTPRQRCAIARPALTNAEGNHPRYHRRNGYWQSILTFDLFREEVPECLLEEHGMSGRVGVWHARIAMYPTKLVSEWSAEEVNDARTAARRLVVGVGQGSTEIAEGADQRSLHVFRWATISEVAQAIRSQEGRK